MRQNKNYAQAAAQPKHKTVSHTNNSHQQHHHQQVSQQNQQNQSSGPSTSSNFSSSANGKPINNSQTKPQAQHNSAMGNGNTGRSASTIKQKNAVQLPTNGHAWEKAPTSIEFGTVNNPNAQISSLSPSTGQTFKSGGGIPMNLSTKGGPTFGTLPTNTTQATQDTPTTVGTSGPGANNNNNNSSNNNNNNNNGAPKPISARANEIPRTHSAPPQFQDSNNRNVGQSGPISNVGPARTQPTNIHQQQSAAVPHQQSSVSVSNPPHRKDSVSSTVSSNDGQQQQFHPHHPPHHSNHSHTNQHVHAHYGRHQQRPHGGQYPPPRQRDKNGPQHPSPHLNTAQPPVPTQGTMMPLPPQYIYPNRDYMPFFPYSPHMYVPGPYTHRPPPPIQQHINPVVNFKPSNSKSKAIEIIDPNKNAPIQFNKSQQLSKSPNYKKEEALPPAVADKKPEEPNRERSSSEEKGSSKAVPIVDPAEKDKEERERKEREEQERITKEKEQKEREEREKKEREEQERIAREKEEKERKEREECERKEREEQERIAREKEEQERKEREERERKEREEQERIAKEKAELERKEREERERLEAERIAKEKEEKERKEREEREEQERIAKEKEKEEQERKEREERLEAERREKERKEAEEKAHKEQEAKEKEEKERQEAERKKKEEEEARAKAAAEEAEKKKESKEAESADKKDSKKEEKKYSKANRPGPLDLSQTKSDSIPSAPLSALGSARIIDDLNSVSYPPHIKSPNPALNSNAEPGKFKYDRNFLMQFMGVCKEKPENLPALEAIGMEDSKDEKKNRPGSSTRTNSRTHKGSPNQSQFTNMGEFKVLPKTSEERFLVASMNMRNGTSSASGIFGRTPLGRTGSGSTLLPAPAMSSTVNPPSPGGRTLSGRSTRDRRGGKGTYQGNMGQEQVAPLERSENRWVPGFSDPVMNNLPKATEDVIPLPSVQRKVKALLNKLTLEKFDSISDQIIDYANKSRDEKDGRILREVIRLIFEKSCDESNFCAMYAQLCRKMMERVDPEIVDENVKNTEGKFVQGGTLFRKYLLNRCQEDFEKGWKVNVPVPSNEKGEPDLMSDEYYVAAKAKRQGLGLIRFIGELFKLNMLTERIMHECIKKLLIFQGSPEEEEMESLCKLMNTVGEQLDHVKTNQHEHIKANQLDNAKAKQLMESYFSRLEEIAKLPNLSSRIKFMIMDVIDLRSNAWKPRRDINAPKTIAEIHEDAAKQKEEAEFLRRTASSGGRGMPKMADQMSRSGSGSGRRDHKGMAHGSASSGNDGWSTVGGSSAQRNKDKVGDLTKFGSVNRSKISGNVSLAPGGNLLGGGAKGWNRSDNKDRDDKATGLSRTNSTSNMYSVLTHADSSEGRKSSELPTSDVQKPPTERKKIILAPRSKSITSEEPQAAAKPTAPKSTSETASSVQSMSEELAIKRINNMMEEYFSVLDIQEVILCLKEIPKEYHAKAIESFANKVIEKKQKDVDNVMNLFKEIVSTGTSDIDTFKDGFKATLDFLMDIGADAPMAYSFTGQLLYSAGLDFRDITNLLKPLDNDMEIEKIVKGYLNNDMDDQKVQKINEFDFKSLFPKKNKDDILEDLGLGSLKK